MAIMLEVRPDVSEREQIYHLKEQLELYLNAQEDIRQAVVNATKGEKGDPGPPGPKGDKGDQGDPGGGATTYSALPDKPMIEGVTLVGDKSYEDLNLQPITNSEMEDMLT